ncbi:FAD dependent oxidoreductase-domain-containing protein [Vararia minispora EC-137]|uniref:FAD dependent oxidoreductase-domain-containing protein n=1 Tax=Vararia minispora EC-137 TaxID=1314806 RepID=A0ACB8QAG5_9AGAM|nr:FAD dependent oxidoreductase-domain-containing protein [Vararia minispora EC-137]
MRALVALVLVLPFALARPLDGVPPEYTAQAAQHAFAFTTLPVENPTHSFWTHGAPDANPLARVGSTGPLPPAADVCVVGSGISGVSVAHHLAHLLSAHPVPSVRVAIFEARDFCSGATGRNGGHLTPYSFAHFGDAENVFGTREAARAVALEDHVADSIAALADAHGWANEIDLVAGGRISLGDADVLAGARDDFARAESARVDGLENVEWIEKDAMRERFGTAYAGWRTPGNNVWPLKFVTRLFGLAQASPALNLTLHTHAPVTSITPSANTTDDASGRWTLHTPRGTTSCGTIVHAANAYTRFLLPEFAITPVRGQVIATRARADANLSLDAFLLEGMYWFPRPADDEHRGPLIVLGGGHTPGTYNDAVRDPVIGKDLRAFLPSVFPGKFDVDTEPEVEWTGIMGFTPSGDPYVGPVRGAPGQFVTAGFSGHGMPRAFGCADVVARMVAGRLNGSGEWDVPAWLPRHYLTDTDGARGL